MWRVYATPTRLVCNRCGGAARAIQGPISVGGRVAYGLVVTIVVVFLLRDFGNPSRLFWPVVFTLPFVAIGVQCYFTHSAPLQQRERSPATLREAATWLVSAEARRALVQTVFILVGFALWLFLVIRVAQYLRGIPK